jgi:hypothetical protein
VENNIIGNDNQQPLSKAYRMSETKTFCISISHIIITYEVVAVIFFMVCFLSSVVLGIELTALHMLGKYATTALYSQPGFAHEEPS